MKKRETVNKILENFPKEMAAYQLEDILDVVLLVKYEYELNELIDKIQEMKLTKKDSGYIEKKKSDQISQAFNDLKDLRMKFSKKFMEEVGMK